MTKVPRHSFSGKIARARAVLPLTAALTLAAGMAGAGQALAAPAAVATAAPYSCAANGPAGAQMIYGTFGDAGVIGWAGNTQAVVACLGGSFFVDTSGPDGGPGSNSTAAVTGTTYGYGIYDDSPTTWANADGYLPALVTTFHGDGATISITNFGDEVSIGGDAFVIIYSRVQVINPTSSPITIDPGASAGLVPLSSAPDAVPPHGTVNHDYAVPSDKFGGTYPYPSSSAIVAAGGFGLHFAHMAAFWNGRAGRHRPVPAPARPAAGGRLPDRVHLHPDHPQRRGAEDRRQRL